MFTVPTYHLAQESEYAAQRLTGLDDFIVGIKKSVDQYTFLAVTLVLAVPSLAYCLVLNRRSKRIYKELGKGFPGFNTPEEYRRFKQTHSRMQEMEAKLKRIAKYNINEMPLPARPAIWQVKKVSKALLAVLAAMDTKLSPYNKFINDLKKKEPSLRFISEKELWAKRTTAYEYLM